MFEINEYVLIAVIIITIIIAIICIYITNSINNTIKFAIKQRNLNIQLCIEKKISYKEIKKQYDKILKEAGITLKKERDELIKKLMDLHK